MVVASIGVLAAASVVVAIGIQLRRATWDTDGTLAARSAIEAVMRAGYQSAGSGSFTIQVGGRSHSVSQIVTVRAPRLKHIRVSIVSPNAKDTVRFETYLAEARPLTGTP